MSITTLILEILGVGLGLVALGDYLSTVVIRTVKRINELRSSRRR